MRQATLYAYPEATDYGLIPIAETGAPLTTTLTSAGQGVFNYLNPNVEIPVSDAYTYLGVPAPGAVVTPLLEFVDTGHIYATAVETYPIVSIFDPVDAGEQMVVTAAAYYPATPPVSLHGRLLPYGIINWATKGVFLGQRHLYFEPQVDDVLSYGDRWDPITHTTIFDTGYRLQPSDVDNLLAWMTVFRATPNASSFLVEMAFNGEGVDYDSDPNTGQIISGTLTDKLMQTQSNFTWLNHTWSHQDLYTVTYQTAYQEIYSNTLTAQRLGFTDYTTSTLLPGAYTV